MEGGGGGRNEMSEDGTGAEKKKRKVKIDLFTWKRRAMCSSADCRFQSVKTSGATVATISRT